MVRNDASQAAHGLGMCTPVPLDTLHTPADFTVIVMHNTKVA